MLHYLRCNEEKCSGKYSYKFSTMVSSRSNKFNMIRNSRTISLLLCDCILKPENRMHAIVGCDVIASIRYFLVKEKQYSVSITRVKRSNKNVFPINRDLDNVKVF